MPRMEQFLNLDGIPGESLDPQHHDEIQVASFSWAESKLVASSPGSGGVASQRARPQDLKIFKHVDKATPLLFLQCAKGQRLHGAVLTVRRLIQQGQPPLDLMKITLSDILLTSYQVDSSADGDATPTESVTLSSTKIKVEYVPVRLDGSPGQAVRAGWDFSTNQPI